MHFGRAREAIWRLLETALIPKLFLLQRDDMLISGRPIVSQEGPVDEGLTTKTDRPSEAAMLLCYSRLLVGYSWRAEKLKPKIKSPASDRMNPRGELCPDDVWQLG